MLDPIFNKSQRNWESLASKPVLLASGLILTVLTLLAFIQADRKQRLAITIGATPAIASLVILGYHKGKFDQLNYSKQQAEQQLKRKQQEIQQLKAVLKHQQETYQARETSLKQQNNQLRETKAELEQQLQQTQQELSQRQLQLNQQQQAYENLQDSYQQMERLLTEENDQIIQDKQDLEQAFKEQETAYLQEIESLETSNQQLAAELTHFHQQNQASLNNGLTQSRSFAHLKIALIGGHPRACQRAKNELEKEYGFDECKIIANEDHEISANRIQSKLKDVDQIFIVTGYNQHSLSNKVNELKNTGKLKGKILWITKRGSRGMVKAIFEKIQS